MPFCPSPGGVRMAYHDTAEVSGAQPISEVYCTTDPIVSPNSHRYPTRFSLNNSQHLLPPPDTSSATTPTPSIPQLPDEILQLILSNFSSYDQGTLSSFDLASKHFYSLSYPKLWSWLRLSPQEEYHPTDIVESDDPPPSILIEVKKVIKKVTITSHADPWCLELSTLTNDLPDIAALELVLNPREIDSQRFIHAGISCQPGNPGDECHVLQGLQAKNLIIRNVSTYALHLYDKSINLKSWSKVKNLILVSPGSEPGCWSRQAALCSPEKSRVPHLKRIYWIFDPTSELPQFHSHGENHKMPFLKTLIYLIIRYPEVGVILVNSGCTEDITNCTNGRVMQKTCEERQREVESLLREGIEQMCNGSFWLSEDIESRQKTVEFKTLQEFLQDDGWEDWFDWKEVEGWKKSMSEMY
ncbi:hypothetical protein I302_100424 [Kwoniella bestiolae CBS 10118]|uniref:Uncharacterized protein n=1 Tax=Kwoniella bestiolae CBS 10118 TaxID=1296100 RepID=A0A1B9G537_9TREE|nr:hypothetical protein I302_03800 [Kwoniella bestiolae CBS 10118]OCF26123.1 hypothetical protein I302_03800 [Kwoniella bestiolae CBS 10118]